MINNTQITSVSNILDLTKKNNDVTKERLDKKSILGTNRAGITIKLDIIYVTLLWNSQENIL